jgi:phenylacetic acid degradation operon negative regulatory protein
LGTQVHPDTIIFSLYGQYVLPRGGEIWVGSLIRALAALDFSPGAVRALVSRMQRKGFLRSQRVGRLSFYRLTDLGLKEVRWGGDRAFSPSDDEWDGRWTVVTYSVPEKQRERRDVLRRSLKSWGFGPLAPGTWISPHQLSPEAESKWRALDVWEYLEVFQARHLGPSDPNTLVAHAWPRLSTLADRYWAYLAEYERALSCLEADTLDDEECFATHLRSLFEFVAITLNDPALPPSLLPEDWPRPSAHLLFKKLQRALARPAERFFGAIYGTKGETNGKRKQL